MYDENKELIVFFIIALVGLMCSLSAVVLISIKEPIN